MGFNSVFKGLRKPRKNPSRSRYPCISYKCGVCNFQLFVQHYVGYNLHFITPKRLSSLCLLSANSTVLKSNCSNSLVEVAWIHKWDEKEVIYTQLCSQNHCELTYFTGTTYEQKSKVQFCACPMFISSCVHILPSLSFRSFRWILTEELDSNNLFPSGSSPSISNIKFRKLYCHFRIPWHWGCLVTLPQFMTDLSWRLKSSCILRRVDW